MTETSDAVSGSQTPGADDQRPERAAEGRRKAGRRMLWLLLRLAVAAGLFAYLFSIVDVGKMVVAFKRISIVQAVAALAFMYGTTFLGGVRWRFIFRAYGASRIPSVSRLVRLQLVGVFYNTVLPGGVGGDVVRGVAARDAFDDGATTSSLAVVLVDRAAGLAGLLAVATTAFILYPLPGVGGVAIWGPLGLLASASTVLALALGRASARFLPGRLAELARSLPELRSALPFLYVLVVSVFIWLLLAAAGHLLVSSIDSTIEASDSFVIIPLAAAAVYFPLTVAGLGAREAAFVFLFRTVGVAEADAMAGSLCFLACQLVIALSGGALSVMFPLNESRSS